jgi:shikimate kinase
VSCDRRIKNLSLIGFMGTGKSTVGRAVAEVLRFSLVDTDHLIESATGLSISEIFARQGEVAFRDWEARVVRELSNRDRTVIATGGGLPIRPENLANLKTHSLVVCLWASAETIYERVKDHAHRPLLQDPDPLGKIRRLLSEREPYYRQADVLVNADFRTVRELAAQIAHHFQTAHPACE